jgi:sugar lactone lactonase YvrE
MRLTSFTCAIALGGCATHSGGGGGDGGTGGRPPFTTGVSTLAGDGMAGYLDGDREINLFHNPVNVAYGPDGKVYVADFDNGKLRAVDAEGTASTIVAQAGFSRPFGLAFAPDGTLYVSTDNDPDNKHDLMSGTIWRVDVQARTATPIAIDVGRPRSLVVLNDGHIAAADDLHHVVEIFTPATGAATVIAGTWDAAGFADGKGPAARFDAPYGVVQRGDGSLVVVDHVNHRLRGVALDGTTTTLAGSAAGFADGAMTGAMFDFPQGIAMASNGDLFITDIGNARVRRISGDAIVTIAGDGTTGYVDNDDNHASEFFGLEGLAVKPDGSIVYVADGTGGGDAAYNRVRQIDLAP